MDTLLRVFVNHRPVYGVGKAEIKNTFYVLSKDGTVSREKLIELLLTKGENMNDGELKGCLLSLLGPSDDIYDSLPADINSDYFLEKILGLVEVMNEQFEGDNQIIEEDEEN